MMQVGTQGGMALDSHGPLFDLVRGVGMRPMPSGPSAPCSVPPPHRQSSENDTRNHPHHLSSAATAVFEGHEEGKDEEPSHPVLDTASLLFNGQAWVSSLTKAYPASRRRALLIVCDASDALSLAERARMDGFAIEIARSALSGLALLAVQPFDVVVSELSFPMVDGLEMVQRLREFENDDEFLDRSPSPTEGHGKGKMPPRVQGGSRGAFVVLVRNGTDTLSGFEAEALDAGADYFVDEFDDVRCVASSFSISL
jgi:CheY-like chemotaxis protein